MICSTIIEKNQETHCPNDLRPIENEDGEGAEKKEEDKL